LKADKSNGFKASFVINVIPVVDVDVDVDIDVDVAVAGVETFSGFKWEREDGGGRGEQGLRGGPKREGRGEGVTDAALETAAAARGGGGRGVEDEGTKIGGAKIGGDGVEECGAEERGAEERGAEERGAEERGVKAGEADTDEQLKTETLGDVVELSKSKTPSLRLLPPVVANTSFASTSLVSTSLVSTSLVSTSLISI